MNLNSAALYLIASVLSHGRKPMYIKTNEGGIKRRQAGITRRSGMAPQRYTVKPRNKGHFGDGPVVPCREVVLFSEVFF